MAKIKFPIILFGTIWIIFNSLKVNADTEHVHIRLKIPKLINKHTHVETKYIHIFHPTPVKIPGFHHRKDGHAPQPFNATSMEIKKPHLNHFEPSSTLMQKHHKINSKEIFNHRYKNMRNIKGMDDDYDFPTALPSHGTSPNAQNLKYFVLDPPQNGNKNQGLIATTQPLSAYSTTDNLMGSKSLPFTSQATPMLLSSGYNKLSSQELNASPPSPPQRLNRIPPPIPIAKNTPSDDDSFEERGKTKYWTASGKRLGKKKPYHGPKNTERAESKRIKMTIRPKAETIKVTKLPFIIKV